MELATSTTKSYRWEELSREEQANLAFAASTVDNAAPKSTLPMLSLINVVDFRQESLEGLHKQGSILIARKCLETEKRALEVLVHEAAHEISGCPDGVSSHTRTIEGLWSAIYWSCTSKNSSILC